ncbi:hypothetical protein [Streptomyces violascens]|uniref:hypothetical protein n=1 Tax=Streptomyces violascens TaxID=67381 RepID=UPI001672F20F|nr:hypothetical protein [Streptomyces violascens]GGU48698.1 hypothetical protein GCM10010289_81500 [Streptomyces violascens]
MKELAVDGVPVTVTCRVLKLARQPYYRWLGRPVADAVLEEAYRANALFDAHCDHPEFGYRFLADEARGAGAGMADRTAWRICRDNRWWSVFGKKRGRGRKVGPPVHNDLVSRHFTATGQNRLWLADITEHATSEGKLYLCAIKDVFSNRIVGYQARATNGAQERVRLLFVGGVARARVPKWCRRSSTTSPSKSKRATSTAAHPAQSRSGPGHGARRYA